MILRPSNAYRWSRCVGSLALQTIYPESEDSPEAREGTAAHFYVTERLLGRPLPVGTITPNGHPITQEMIDCGGDFVADVVAELAASSSLATFRVETKVYPHILIHPQCEGTPDAYLVDSATKRIIVWDYKFGHRYVDPFWNEQGVCYMAGVIEGAQFTLEDLERDGWSISFRVAAPRNYMPGAVKGIRRWDISTPAQLYAQIEHLRNSAYVAATGGPCETGEHCRDCSARLNCEASLKTGSFIIDCASESTPVVLSREAMAMELKFLWAARDRLEARATALEEVIIAELRAGRPVPQWTLEHGEAREQWTVEPDEVFIMGDMMGVDLRSLKPITPPQARAAGVDAELVKAYSNKPRGKAKLSLVTAASIAKAFS